MVIHTIYRKVHSLALTEFVTHFSKKAILRIVAFALEPWFQIICICEPQLQHTTNLHFRHIKQFLGKRTVLFEASFHKTNY